MDNFLPEGYQVPQTQGNYMKLEKGDNKIRVMSSAITGFEYWTTDNKPVRSAQMFSETPNIKLDMNGKKSIKPFWAFVVWNFDKEKIQILEITQTGIMNTIKALVDNPEWGNPNGYNLVIRRTGDGFDTEYSVTPSPHSPVPEKAKSEYERHTIELTKLYTGEDPFVTSITPQDQQVREEKDYGVTEPIPGQENNNQDIRVEDIPFG